MSLREEYSAFKNEVDRQGFILSQVVNGNTPTWVHGKWTQVNIKDSVNELQLFFMPDALAIGSNSAPIYTPVYPSTLQSVADVLDAIILSEKLVNIAFANADQKIPFRSEALGEMTSVKEFLLHSDYIFSQVNQWKVLRQGHSKAVVIGPNLSDKELAIYGGYGGKVDGWAIQGYNRHSHVSTYLDYSQLGWLVSNKANLNGKDVSLKDVFTNPAFCYLVSNDGYYNPRYPNAGGAVGSALTPGSVPAKIPPTTIPGRPPTTRSAINTNEAFTFGLILSLLGSFASYRNP